MYLGDFKEDGDIFFKFTTRAFATGIPTVLANTPVLSVFIDENTTGKTTAESYFDLDVSLGSIVGYNNVRIDLSGDAFFATGGDYSVVITTGTVDSVSVVGETLAAFSIENRSMGQPVGATLAADIAALKTDTVAILDDTDLIDDGTSGLAKIATDVAAVLVDTGTTLQAELDAIQAAVITNAAGVDIAADIIVVKSTVDNIENGVGIIVQDTADMQPRVVAIEADTNELQTDNVPGLIATAQADLDTITDTDGVILGAAGVDLVWDEVLTGATHNVATSAGRRLRQLEASFVITAGTAQAGGAATITLASGESATDNIFAGDRCIIVGGTGIGEHGIITAYDGGTKVATMSQNWVIQPDNTSEYELAPADVDVETWQHTIVTISGTSALPEVDAKSLSDSTAAADALEASAETIVVGAAEAGTLSTTQMTSDLSEATDDHYNGRIVIWTSGVLKDQASDITDYLGSTGMVTYTATTEAPSAADTFVIV